MPESQEFDNHVYQAGAYATFLKADDHFAAAELRHFVVANGLERKALPRSR